MGIDWAQYDPGDAYDELVSSPGHARRPARGLLRYLRGLSDAELAERKAAAELAIKVMGITFTVYGEGGSIDRAWPFDIVPRVMPLKQWTRIEAGLKQRLTALNLFIDDIYNDQRIVKDGVFPENVLAHSKNFRTQCQGIKPPFGAWAHICGTDLVRDRDGTVYVLEDNLRVPSGVSYMLQNRAITKRVLPELFQERNILPVDDYATELFDMLASISPRPLDNPEIVVLTPGIYNSAYFEHAFLAQQLGVELVQGGDERPDYAAAMRDYHDAGPVENWQESYISAYACAHPWEDWAETWAHYLHMTDTLETAASFGVAPAVEQWDFAQRLGEWIKLTIMMNALNRSMGVQDAYPFVLSPAANKKLQFVDRVVSAQSVASLA